MSKIDIYDEKKDTYFSIVRWNIINLIPEGDHRILEIGCGSGATLKVLKETGKAKEICGIEINKNLSKQLSQDLDRYVIGDVESIDIPFEENYFDYILYGDVLEHLISPEKVLNKYKKVLKDDGIVIASIPNIKYFSILLNLILFDKFEYANSGILDKSHLRFFTKKEIKKMFEKENLKIVDTKPNFWWPIKAIDKIFFNVFSKLLPGKSFFTIQYIIKAMKEA